MPVHEGKCRREKSRVGAWSSSCQRCFLQRIDQAKAIPMVGSSAKNNDVRKVGWKSSPKIFWAGDVAAKGSKASYDEGGVAGVRHDH